MSEKLKDSTIVVGLGSPIMSDDAVGLKIAEHVGDLGISDIETRQEAVGGLDILPLIRGFRFAVIVDSILTGSVPPGTVMIFDPEHFEHTVVPASAHDVNLATAIAIGRQMEPDMMPEAVRYVAVEACDIQTVSESMTPDVEAAIPSAVNAVLHLISEFRKG
ncbi:MAG: hydrogenase maturation protease [Candidatus Methanomethylophilaceae archaeon]|jgi:hydrogenase maturation protease